MCLPTTKTWEWHTGAAVALKIGRKKTVAPAGSYSELKLNVGTCCGLLWSLFGEHCNYYMELLKIYRVLDRQECFSIREAYTKEVCARITWAILDNGCSVFGQTVVAADFVPRGHHRLHPQCKLGPTSNVSLGVDVSLSTRQLLAGTAGWGTPNKLGDSPRMDSGEWIAGPGRSGTLPKSFRNRQGSPYALWCPHPFRWDG